MNILADENMPLAKVLFEKFGNVTLKTSGDAVIVYTVNGISKSITIHSTKA